MIGPTPGERSHGPSNLPGRGRRPARARPPRAGRRGLAGPLSVVAGRSRRRRPVSPPACRGRPSAFAPRSWPASRTGRRPPSPRQRSPGPEDGNIVSFALDGLKPDDDVPLRGRGGRPARRRIAGPVHHVPGRAGRVHGLPGVVRDDRVGPPGVRHGREAEAGRVPPHGRLPLPGHPAGRPEPPARRVRGGPRLLHAAEALPAGAGGLHVGRPRLPRRRQRRGRATRRRSGTPSRTPGWRTRRRFRTTRWRWDRRRADRPGVQRSAGCGSSSPTCGPPGCREDDARRAAKEMVLRRGAGGQGYNTGSLPG